MFQSPALNEVLAAELAAGNAVAEDGQGFGGASRIVILARRFTTPRPPAGSGLAYRDIRDPHFWWAEVEATDTREVLACR